MSRQAQGRQRPRRAATGADHSGHPQDRPESAEPRRYRDIGDSDLTAPVGTDRGHRAAARTAEGARAAGRGLAVGGRALARATAVTTRSTVRVARRASAAQGAGETGLHRLIQVHAFSSAGDAALMVGLAGTMFFQVPQDQARNQVLLFLLLTMLPFAIVAPLIGPLLDRFRHGRRWSIGATMAIRSFLCWVLASSITTESWWQFPAALGVLVASKAYLVTRSSAAPRLLPQQLTLVKANGRLSLAGTVGAGVGGGLAAAAARFGPEWALRVAFVLFIGGTVLAVLLPARVDSSHGEEQAQMRDLGPTPGRGVGPLLVTALRANSGLRWLSGFLTLYLAFLLREHPFPGWETKGTLLLALVIGAAGVGNAIGTMTGALVRTSSPRVIVLFTLLVDAVVAVVAAVRFNIWTAVAVGLVAGLCQQMGKLALDAIIQDSVAEQIRTSVFARSETVLQLSWVIGGLFAALLPLNAAIGMTVAAVLLVVWTVAVVIWNSGRKVPLPARPRSRAQSATAAPRPRGSARPQGRPFVAQDPQAPEPEASAERRGRSARTRPQAPISDTDGRDRWSSRFGSQD
ncbi:MFS transporter [Dermacoccaceae bacterium W4C1]